MKIEKIINNNIISARDSDGNEIVVMGRGIGFQSKAGQEITNHKIEKIFRIENKDSLERFKNLLRNLPLEYVELTDEIISYARQQLEIQMSQTVYLTLMDHISFVIDQHKLGHIFTNALHEEVKRFYPDEYMIGIHALTLIQEKTGEELIRDEAASIALHLVNAEFNLRVKDTWIMTNLMQDMLEIIVRELGVDMGDSFYKGWLVVNLKFLAHRMLWIPPSQNEPDAALIEFTRGHYGQEYALTEKVKQYISGKYNCTMTEEENLYFVLNIKRIRDLYL